MKTIFYFLVIMSTSNIYSQEFSNPGQLFDPTPYGFSHVAVVPPDTKLVFIAGQGGEENKEGRLSSGFREQVQHALQNIQHALKSKGTDMNAVVKVTTLVVDHDAGKLQVIVEEFERMWPKKNFPVNTLIPVPRLALDNMQIEIDAVAVLTRQE
jgi:enamine deaminase RidA (YjgF/YER057c/UK114 family)